MADPLEPEYPIAAVSKLTGVSCHALRVWERRYGFPVPSRSASGHRRYLASQVALLRRVSELLQSGRSVGAVIAELREGTLEAGVVAPAVLASEVALKGRYEELLDRLLCGDVVGGGLCFGALEAAFSVEDLVNRVIAPALTEAGERWFSRRCGIYQEHCVSGFIRGQLGRMIDSARLANPTPIRTVLVGTVQGDRHEGGVLIANVLMERAGWRVINLGVDLPVAEYVRAVERFRPDALALSFVLSRNINKRFLELSTLCGMPVFVGGRSIVNYQGLARRCGLTPVPGVITVAIEEMSVEFATAAAAWLKRRSKNGDGPRFRRPPPRVPRRYRRLPRCAISLLGRSGFDD